MDLKTFFENFELMAEAPNGVQKLREMILQLAVQGKLVPQDPNDEPASVLLDKIKAEKERLVKAKKMRKSKPLPHVKDDEIPFRVPKTWKWCRLNDYGDWGAGATPNRSRNDYYGGIIPWFKSGELNDAFVSTSKEHVTEKAMRDCSLRMNPPGDVLVAMYGATIGKVGIADVECTTNQAVCACTCFKGILNHFLFLLLKAYKPRFISRGEGGAQPNISRIKIIGTVVPLPPFEEQKRIVAKVDELMALCDELEAQKQKASQGCIKLNDASIDKLLTAPEPKQFNKDWQRIYDNFDLLYSKPENVAKLRQAILQLAVQGKLVPQDPKDEPASVLLEKIKAEKERLGKANLKNTFFQELNLTDIPFELPDRWLWTRWDWISLKIGDVDHKMPVQQKNGIPYVSPRDFGPENFIDFNNAKKISIDDFRRLSKKIVPEKEDIIFPRYGTIGENRYVETERDFLASYSCAVIKCMKAFVDSKYVFYYSMSPLVKKEIDKYINKTTQANVGVKSIKNFLFPLPPLHEQRRIVAKVDELMALCDELETSLSKSKTDCNRLAETCVTDILAA